MVSRRVTTFAFRGWPANLFGAVVVTIVLGGVPGVATYQYTINGGTPSAVLPTVAGTDLPLDVVTSAFASAQQAAQDRATSANQWAAQFAQRGQEQATSADLAQKQIDAENKRWTFSKDEKNAQERKELDSIEAAAKFVGPQAADTGKAFEDADAAYTKAANDFEKAREWLTKVRH